MARQNMTEVRKDVERDLLIEMDPNTPATGIRIAFVAESILNLFMGIPMVVNPRSALQGQFLPMFDRTADILQQQPSPEAASITQYMGAFTLVLNVGLLLGVPNKPGAIEIRRTVYSILAALEAVFVAIVLWQVLVGGESATGVSREKAIRIFLVPMPIACLLRLWVLFKSPQSMGRYTVKRTN
jgi:hypothetical protein